MGIDLTGLGSVADLAKGIVDRIFPPSANPEEKLKAQTELQRMIEERENTVVKAKTDIMVAELNQDDRYTKRGRPTILYGGLLFIGLNHVLFPMLAWVMNFAAEQKAPVLPNLSLPEEFWWAWAGVCSIYVLGRSAEKMGGESGGLVGKIFGGIGAKK